MIVTASAPGKLMLFGEHAVVYGYPCLVTTVDLRVSTTIERTQSGTIDIAPSLPGEAEQHYLFTLDEIVQSNVIFPKAVSFVASAIAHFFRRYNVRSGLHIMTTGLAKNYGLGSSSAITVATIAALNALFDVQLSSREIFDLAFAVVLDVQRGTASGFDVAAAVYGGTVYYSKRGDIIEPLELPAPSFIVGYSGEKVSTTDYVEQVRRLYQQMPTLIEPIFALMTTIVEQARLALHAGDHAEIGRLMNINQGLLDSLGVNTLSLARPIFAARDAGALGAKLSGAGGGDCMFAIADDDARGAVITAMQSAGCEVLDVALHTDGVCIDT